LASNIIKIVVSSFWSQKRSTIFLKRGLKFWK